MVNKRTAKRKGYRRYKKFDGKYYKRYISSPWQSEGIKVSGDARQVKEWYRSRGHSVRLVKKRGGHIVFVHLKKGRPKKVRRTKKFNGKVYRPHSSHRHKSDAQRYAKRLRDKGKGARVVYKKSAYGNAWMVYFKGRR